ncbi:endo-1,4-beta-xylanase [Geochorda subterranea]|uniref:Beta-xylanase n=1 Tax=Geochorda subterranea TaxID=3109564 RepID=A0ABZ1BSA3_9FIRM|nr:endo-1,4-beta-xylanase [Limnochorda sp. LNt]WRP15614.1 endo-1,4-beta-xylanase [Limnochorda sp. LNt]
MHRRRLVVALAVVALFAGLWGVPKATAWAQQEGDLVQEPSLRELAAPTGLRIGFASANDFWTLPDAATYQRLAAREFDILTPENQMKWDSLRPAPDRFDFEAAERHVAFAAAHGMQVHGHTLVWHNQLPAWLTTTRWTPDALEGVLEEHIRRVVGHFRGRVAVWDVVNEALDEDGRLRESFWYVNLGPSYIEKAFTWAREADPDAILIYNDYNIEVVNAKSDALYEMMVDFKRRGVPVDGIGFQMHVTHRGLDYGSLRRNLERFADLGLSLYITEMDVRIPGEPDMERLLQQAEVYRRVLQIALPQPRVAAVQFWGFTDRYSWVPQSFPGQGAALVFDRAYRAKPAYYALKEVLSAFVAAFKPYRDLQVIQRSPERYEVRARVHNTGAAPEVRDVALRIDGQVVASQRVELLPREERPVAFEHTFDRRGTYWVAVGDLPAVEVTVPGRLGLLQPSVWLDFEDGVGNRSTSGIVARPSGAVRIGETGRIGRGIEFDGEGRLELDDPLHRHSGGHEMLTLPTRGGFTLALWFKPDFPEGAAGPFALLDASRNPIYFAVSITRQGLSWYYEDGTDADFQMDVPAPLDDGQWHHLAVTGAFGQPGVMAVYLDGELRAARDIVASPAGPLSPLVIGHDSDPTYFPTHVGFVGSVDEVRVFPWILTADEIREVMASHAYASQPGTHVTEWVSLEPGETLRSLTVHASVGAADRVEATVETSLDGQSVSERTTLTVEGGEATHPLALGPARYFRIRTVLDGFSAAVLEYEAASSSGRRWLWSTTEDWARGIWSSNVDLGAPWPVEPPETSTAAGPL